jgi:hypothetical protein
VHSAQLDDDSNDAGMCDGAPDDDGEENFDGQVTTNNNCLTNTTGSRNKSLLFDYTHERGQIKTRSWKIFVHFIIEREEYSFGERERETN